MCMLRRTLNLLVITGRVSLSLGASNMYILSVQLKVWNISDINFINSAAALRFVAILDRKAR